MLSYFEKGYVLATSNQNVLPSEELPISDQLEIFKIPTFDYRTLASLMSKNQSITSGSQFSEESKSTFIVQKIIQLQRSFPFNIFLAEGSIFYIIMAFIKANFLIKRKKVDVIFSSFMPYADHLIAYMLKSKFPHLIWVADFRDLHVEPIYKNVFWPGFQKKIEKLILKKADFITTVSDGISKKMMELHSNVYTLMKGVSLRKPEVLFDRFTIHYSGSLFRDFRDPKPLLRAISKLLFNEEIAKDEISFLYAGKDGTTMQNAAEEFGLGEIFENRGFIDRKTALSLQDKSHINLLLTSSSFDHSGLLTGKLFEYVEAGREILCLINGVQDKEIETFFERYNLGSVLYNDDDIENYIINKFKEWKTTKNVRSWHKRREIQQDLGWECQAEKLHKLIISI